MWCFSFPFLMDKTVISNGCSSTCFCSRPFHSCTRHSQLTSSAIVNFFVRKVVCSIIGSRPDGLGLSKARYHLENFSFYVAGYGHDYGKLKPSVSHFCRVCSQEGRGMFIRFLIWFTHPEIQQVQLNSLSLEWQDKLVKLSELLKFGLYSTHLEVDSSLGRF